MQITCRQRRISMLLLIICFLMLGISLIITWMNPADKYEVSIFSSTPNIYWLSLLISLFVGFFIVTKFIFSEGNKICKNSALILLFIAYTSFLSLWIIRGYYLWCSGDPLTHLGWIKDTILTGHTSKDIFYPITHIYLAQISTILSINPIIPHKYIPLIFAILHVLFMFLFAKSIIPDKLFATIVLLISFIPMHEYYLNLTPHFLSNLFIPLVFFILLNYIRKRSYHWCILLLVMIFLFPAFHPVPSLALLIMIISLTHPVITFARGKVENSLSYRVREQQLKNNRFYMFGILLVILVITWISSFYVWESTIRNLYVLMAEGGTSHLDTLIGDMNYAGEHGYSVVMQFFKVYGGRLIYMIIMMIGCILLWKQFKRNRGVYQQYQYLFYLSIPTILFIFLTGLFFFTNMGFNAERIAFYITIISVLFVGYVISELLRKVKTSFVCSCVSLFFIGLFIIAAPLVYPSPYTLESNWQITKTEITGMDWTLHKKSDVRLTALTISQPGRFAHALLLPEERTRAYIPLNIAEELQVPYHFGYDENDYLGDSYSENVYMVLNHKDRILYKEVFPDVAHLRFLDDDFDKLNTDKSLTKLYENGGFDSWYICSN